MGPRPGVEPGVAEPQSTVLTTRPPQPRCKSATCARYFKQAPPIVTDCPYARTGEAFKDVPVSACTWAGAISRFCWSSSCLAPWFRSLHRQIQSSVPNRLICSRRGILMMHPNGLFGATRRTVKMSRNTVPRWWPMAACQ